MGFVVMVADGRVGIDSRAYGDGENGRRSERAYGWAGWFGKVDGQGRLEMSVGRNGWRCGRR